MGSAERGVRVRVWLVVVGGGAFCKFLCAVRWRALARQAWLVMMVGLFDGAASVSFGRLPVCCVVCFRSVLSAFVLSCGL